MIIKASDVQEKIGPMCPECEYFDWDVITIGKDDIDQGGIQYVQLGCQHEELCIYMQARMLSSIKDLYMKLP